MGTLRPAPEEGESKNWDNTENLYIEGENLEVLKLLQKSYFGKIKMIYIDPPYNTGKDFVYKDNYKDNIKNYKKITGQVDGEGKTTTSNPEYSGRYHTDWLNMMYPRLRLARNLLTEDGVIFISIDDNEIHNLRKICDEVYGEDNFIGMLSVENNPKGRKNSEFISVSSEYLLLFAKDKQKSYFIEKIPKKASDMTKDENGKFVHSSGKRVLVGENSFNKLIIDRDSDKNYSVYYRHEDKSLYLIKEEIKCTNKKLVSEGYVKYYSHNNGLLVENTYTENKFRELFKNGELEFAKEKIYEKNFSDTIRIKSQLVNRKYEAIVRGNRQLYSMELTTTGAGTYLKTIFQKNELVFNAPKNVGYIKLPVSLFENKAFTVLDFFAGSATTADSVMKLNSEDNGNRKYIMVQLPEPTDEKSEAYKAGYKNIAEIGKERIRRAGGKIKSELEEKYEKATEEERKDMKNPDHLDIGFKVFKLDSSNIKEWNPGKYENIQLAIEDSSNPYVKGRTEEDVVYEMMLKMGVDLTYPVEKHEVNGKTIYSIGFGYLMICLSDNIDLTIAQKMIEIKNEHKQDEFRTIFRDEGFNSDTDKTNIKETLKSAGLAEESFITL